MDPYAGIIRRLEGRERAGPQKNEKESSADGVSLRRGTILLSAFPAELPSDGVSPTTRFGHPPRPYSPSSPFARNVAIAIQPAPGRLAVSRARCCQSCH